MSLAQPKSGELLDLLTPSLTKGENLLSEFEVHQIIREAKKIPERYQGLSIEGLAKLVLGEIEEGCSLCEQGLRLAPNDSVSFCNYTIALRNLGLHARQYAMIQNSANSLNPTILAEVATISAYWADIDLLEKVMPMLTAMEVPRPEEMAKWCHTLDYLHTHQEHAQDLKTIGQLMMNVADKYRVRLAGAHAFYVLSELDTLFVEVKTDDPALLSQINNDLADEIINAGLADSECVGCFEAGDF
ncbi:hypothetical protein [Escherichia coli]|uniref:hypothetical protein n=1 Tax=Escherichia coli TaxID=562 RepID=UPI0030F450EE